MHTFETYDFFRLGEYKKRNEKIDFGSNDSFSYYLFNEVDYFNYIFFNSHLYKKNEFNRVIKKYIDLGRNRLKLIFPINMLNNFNHIVDFHFEKHEIVCVKRKSFYEENEDNDKKNLIKVQSWEEILLFTKLYLKGFDSENKNYEDVAMNFQLLLKTNKIDFFLIQHKGEISGICSNFYMKNSVFLCACAVLEKFRYLGLQKIAIDERIKIGNTKGYKNFNSWAYKDSVSHLNMLKSDFKNYIIYGEYISKPLDELIK